MLAAAVRTEMRTSALQARFFSGVAGELGAALATGPAPEPLIPSAGPYDHRLGYTRLPAMLERLDTSGYRVAAQARPSGRHRNLVRSGLFPIYDEKDQAGLVVLDRKGRALFERPFPSRVYRDFDEVPRIVWETLLYIENRELLDPRYPRRNPAVEWRRLGRALVEQSLRMLGSGGEAPGASTLATQLEKLRHSPGGRTASAAEKLRQMLSASLRAYRNGGETLGAQRQIVVSYLNSMPLAGIAGHGEVVGLGDGLWAWYGVEIEDVNRALGEPRSASRGERATAFRQVLSLLLAQRQPTYYLTTSRGRAALDRRTDAYLRLLSRQERIDPALGDAALRARVPLRDRASARSTARRGNRQAARAVRTELLGLLGVRRLHDLDKLDLTVRSTFDLRAQAAIDVELGRLADREYASRAGLTGPRLLGDADPALVRYAVVLYERGAQGNLVRVQTDTLDQPFDVNQGAKLELGSTAKLRTLVAYLEIVESLHREYGNLADEELRAARAGAPDALTRWAMDHLERAADRSLAPMLEAALERRYSASPYESFYTGGGRHTFHNFDDTYDGRVVSVRQAFLHSINLPFIRLMRDILDCHVSRLPGSPATMLEDAGDLRRVTYLNRFVDRESRVFLRRFWDRYGETRREDLVNALAAYHQPTPRRFAWALRSVMPDVGRDAFAALLAEGTDPLEAGYAEVLYDETDVSRFSWHERGYLADMHPLELWLLHYRLRNPKATWTEVTAASADVRQEIYDWLRKPHRRAAQDLRIWTLIEEEGFEVLHRSWQEKGYPFARLIPSLATAIGSSGDRPAALAELVGIIQNGGVRYPPVQSEALRFAAGTPYETIVERAPAEGERVMSPEVAAALRRALLDTVERGTARRARGAVVLPDGEPVAVGGKTGTGDNRFHVYGPGGRLIESRPVNRTATLVFSLGDRHFGTITAYVAGPEAADYRFTSALPAQIFRILAPIFARLVSSDDSVSSTSSSAAWKRLSSSMAGSGADHAGVGERPEGQGVAASTAPSQRSPGRASPNASTITTSSMPSPSIGGRIAKRPSKVTSTGAGGSSVASKYARSRAALSPSWATGSDVSVPHAENRPASAM